MLSKEIKSVQWPTILSYSGSRGRGIRKRVRIKDEPPVTIDVKLSVISDEAEDRFGDEGQVIDYLPRLDNDGAWNLSTIMNGFTRLLSGERHGQSLAGQLGGKTRAVLSIHWLPS